MSDTDKDVQLLGSPEQGESSKAIAGWDISGGEIMPERVASLREIDYVIKDKLLFEAILNMEFTDTGEKGVFYNDDGHSFDQVLFYGHESTLVIFEVLLFYMVDLMSGDFVLSAIIVYLFMEIVYMARNSLSEKNLATKTLVDQRFLI